jgi:hypothetical protein
LCRLLYKELGSVCCSGGLERQLRRLGSDVHVFGHTHINWDKTLNGVRYVQHPLKVRFPPSEFASAMQEGRTYYDTRTDHST